MGSNSGQLDLTRDLCAVCGAPIEQPVTGRRREVCSDACRQRRSRERRRRPPAPKRHETPEASRQLPAFRDALPPAPKREPPGLRCPVSGRRCEAMGCVDFGCLDEDERRFVKYELRRAHREATGDFQAYRRRGLRAIPRGLMSKADRELAQRVDAHRYAIRRLEDRRRLAEIR